jgi:GNAT superfamily N-acetyltransferase
MATDFYDAHGTTGYLWMAEEPWPGTEVALVGDVFGTLAADARADAPLPEGVVIRRVGKGDTAAFNAVRSGNPASGGVTEGGPNPWPQVYEQLVLTNSRQLFVAELNGVAVANASLHVSAATGWLRGALVAPAARGLGIQRALIAARIRAAIEAGCDLVGAEAEPDEVSARNLARMGMRRLGRRSSYVYRPK